MKRATVRIKPKHALRATPPMKPNTRVRSPSTETSEFEKEAAETKAKWQERMREQYASYKHKELRAWVSLYYTQQEKRLSSENRTRIIVEVANLDSQRLEAYDAAIEPERKAETVLAKYMSAELDKIPIWTNYLSEVKGIGPITAACLIAWIDDIGKFDTISKLHRYCGLSAIDGKAQRRYLGAHIDYNPKLKTLCYKIGKSFLTSHNEKYRAVYDEAHAKYESRGKYDKETNPAGNKNKLHTMFRALKVAERIFIANVWVKWRELEGLPISEPYIFAVGGHSKEHLVKP